MDFQADFSPELLSQIRWRALPVSISSRFTTMPSKIEALPTFDLDELLFDTDISDVEISSLSSPPRPDLQNPQQPSDGLFVWTKSSSSPTSGLRGISTSLRRKAEIKRLRREVNALKARIKHIAPPLSEGSAGFLWMKLAQKTEQRETAG